MHSSQLSLFVGNSPMICILVRHYYNWRKSVIFSLQYLWYRKQQVTPITIYTCINILGYSELMTPARFFFFLFFLPPLVVNYNFDLPPQLPTCVRYIDVIMTTMASQITSLAVVYSSVFLDADQRKHQSSASLAYVWGIHRDRWIPRTKGQLRGKCFHLMTSSCLVGKRSLTYTLKVKHWYFYSSDAQTETF